MTIAPMMLNAKTTHLWRAAFAACIAVGLGACQDAAEPTQDATLRDASAAICDEADLTCARGTAGNSCATAIVLPIGTGATNGTNVYGEDHGTGYGKGCYSVTRGGSDRIYTFTLAKPMKVQFTMTGYDTVLHLRTACGKPDTQIACNDDAGGPAAGLNLEMQPGTYYLYADSFKAGGPYTLNYTFVSDPCASNVCGTATCVPLGDWTGYTCQCPDGQVPFNGACIADPCLPNPCTEPHKSRCMVDGIDQYSCDCEPGFIPGNAGACVADPNLPEWTVMVYLNGDNNLEQYGVDNLAQMQKVGSSPKVNIVVLMDTATIGAGTAHKLLVKKGGSTMLANLGEIDMGVAETLADFGVWAVQNYPAKHYLLDLWDHGSGWTKIAPDPEPVKAVSSDDSSGNIISIAKGQYAAGLAPIAAAIGKPIDIVGFDACLMAMWELVNATAPYADILSASEETEPAAGWPYDKFLAPLIANPLMTPKELATKITDTYYAAGSNNATFSGVDLGTLPALNQVVSAFADELLAALGSYRAPIKAARDATRAYYYASNRDLYDFAQRIAATSALPANLKTAARAVMAQVKASTFSNKAQSKWAGSNGIAIYLKDAGTSLDANYRAAGAVWSQNSTWDEFLAAF